MAISYDDPTADKLSTELHKKGTKLLNITEPKSYINIKNFPEITSRLIRWKLTYNGPLILNK